MKKRLILLAVLISLCLLLYLLVRIFVPQPPNVYTKISKGQPISILVAGDSIGAGSGSSKPKFNFANRLKTALQEKYAVTATIVNTSMGGNSTYAPLIRVFKLDKEHNFDLVIICSGENDDISIIGPYYEALIRNIKNKYPNAEIISVLQSSQKKYTDKIKTIQKLANYYDISVADTIKPFTNNENGEYNSLTMDGIHPNDAGYAIYAKTIEDVICTNITSHKKSSYKGKLSSPPLFSEALNYANFIEISTNDLSRTKNSFTGSINLPETTIIGMEVYFIHGSNSYELVINDVSSLSKKFKWIYSNKHFITEINKIKGVGDSTITINFGTSEQANSFKSLFITYPSK